MAYPKRTMSYKTKFEILATQHTMLDNGGLFLRRVVIIRLLEQPCGSLIVVFACLRHGRSRS